MGLEKVEKQVDSFIGSKAFWFVMAFIGLAILFLVLTKPETPSPTYLTVDEDGNPLARKKQ